MNIHFLFCDKCHNLENEETIYSKDMILNKNIALIPEPSSVLADKDKSKDNIEIIDYPYKNLIHLHPKKSIGNLSNEQNFRLNVSNKRESNNSSLVIYNDDNISQNKMLLKNFYNNYKLQVINHKMNYQMTNNLGFISKNYLFHNAEKNKLTNNKNSIMISNNISNSRSYDNNKKVKTGRSKNIYNKKIKSKNIEIIFKKKINKSIKNTNNVMSQEKLNKLISNINTKEIQVIKIKNENKKNKILGNKFQKMSSLNKVGQSSSLIRKNRSSCLGNNKKKILMKIDKISNSLHMNSNKILGIKKRIKFPSKGYINPFADINYPVKNNNILSQKVKI